MAQSAAARARLLSLQLAQELARVQKKVDKDITTTDRQAIGNATVEKMKGLIAAGISPIEGRGRFPEYKAVKERRKSKTSSRGKKSKGTGAPTGYPYTADPFFNKKVRPVNLFLSGEFLDDLKARIRGGQIIIGFAKKKSQLKELGHREGAGGQPKRPVIPTATEKFNASVYRTLLDSLDKVLRRKFGS